MTDSIRSTPIDPRRELLRSTRIQDLDAGKLSRDLVEDDHQDKKPTFEDILSQIIEEELADTKKAEKERVPQMQSAFGLMNGSLKIHKSSGFEDDGVANDWNTEF